MKKIICGLGLIMFSFLICSCDSQTTTTTYENPDYVELLTDPHFETGFQLLGISPVEDKRTIQKHIDYNGNAVESNKSVWYMAQWWTPYNVVDAVYSYENNRHIYKTESRTIEVDPTTGYLRFELLGSKEYGDRPREVGEPWPHILIEQYFNTSVKLSDLQALIVHMEVKVESVTNLMGDAYNPDKHAAQLLWYLTIRNVLPEGADEAESGKNGDFLWFGIPVYDNRHDFTSESASIDRGAAGTTNKLIYSISSRNYLDEAIKMNKSYTIEFDVLPYIKDAFIYAIQHDALVNCEFENMEVGYMNFGWELPGTFDVSSSINNISIKGVYN